MATGSLLSCSSVSTVVREKFGKEPHGNPPEPPTHNPPAPTSIAIFPKAPFHEGQALEPVDGVGRAIHHGGGNCWVELPFETPPTSVMPPPTEAAPCPPDLTNDAAYASCEYGTLTLKALGPPAECICYFFGNPPPSPTDAACPTTTIPGLAAQK